jgi:hypothetical protein
MTTTRVMVLAIAGTIAGGVRAEPANPASSQDDYDERFIGFDELGVFDPHSGALYKLTLPYQGKERKPLTEPEFYRLIGREDLADEYGARDARRKMLIGAGALVALGAVAAGAIIGIQSQPGLCTDADFAAFNACVSRHSDEAHSGMVTGVAVAAGGLLVGGALVLAGALTNPHPLDAVQMRALADGYNRQLKQKVGVRLVPLVTPDTAGVALSLSF